MSCEDPQLVINILQTAACSRIRGSYEHEPIPAQAKSDLNTYLPLWCKQPTATYLLIATGSDKVYKLGTERFVTVGRNASAKVVLSSLSVSRMHAAFLHDSLNQTFLVDLGSSHGTFMGSEKLTPYTPTLVTQKSLIRFGTCETQFLLVTICPELCIAREALTWSSEEDRELYLNTQFNLIHMLPLDGENMVDDTDVAFSRVDTFNFVNSHRHPPALKRVHISSDSIATYSDNSNSPVTLLLPIPNGGSDDLEAPVAYESPTMHLSDPSLYNNGMTVTMSNSPELPRKVAKSENFIYAGSLPNEFSIKRCASTAGVDEGECGSFEPDDSFLAEGQSSIRSCRRRMSEDPQDFACYESDRSMSLEAGEMASIGGSSNGFISSGSMSECEEEEGLAEKKKRKVRFWDFPIEIPDPVDLA